ncbi:13553_t:CDS:2 [Funneliformis geosporum]|uniref:13553_t:CDS:1 n=1 Tax=Funneliformis geosporum TaxID=1117311 RepID=A0A9W4SA23_9GLOM|nr:13553_t:CDS:2 [Funneliformis geosporum]
MEGGMKTPHFYDFLTKFNPDNLSVHKTTKIAELLSSKDIKVIFLPSYTPELNLIKKKNNILKGNLRKTEERTKGRLYSVIEERVKFFQKEDLTKYLNNSVKECLMKLNATSTTTSIFGIRKNEIVGVKLRGKINQCDECKEEKVIASVALHGERGLVKFCFDCLPNSIGTDFIQEAREIVFKPEEFCQKHNRPKNTDGIYPLSPTDVLKDIEEPIEPFIRNVLTDVYRNYACYEDEERIVKLIVDEIFQPLTNNKVGINDPNDFYKDIHSRECLDKKIKGEYFTNKVSKKEKNCFFARVFSVLKGYSNYTLIELQQKGLCFGIKAEDKSLKRLVEVLQEFGYKEE